MVGAADGVFQRAVLDHQSDGMIEIGVLGLAALKRPAPEFAFIVAAASESEHHRKCDLALAEIVADVLAEPRRRAAIVEHVIDQLEGDAEIHAERAAGGGFSLLPRRPRRADLA